MPTELNESLDSFIDQCLNFADKHPDYFSIEFDEEWPSPCYQATGKSGESVLWLPQKQTESLSFKGVERALDIALHNDYCAYFTRYFSFHLPAQASQGQCELLQVCSEMDFERLQENLIGHILMKRRLKQKPTLFFGLTDDDDYLLSLDNASGEVVLERVGKAPEKVLAPDLATFLGTLSPRL